MCPAPGGPACGRVIAGSMVAMPRRRGSAAARGVIRVAATAVHVRFTEFAGDYIRRRVPELADGNDRKETLRRYGQIS